MDGLLPRSVMDTIRRTAKSLKGHARRVFQAVVTQDESANARNEIEAKASDHDMGGESVTPSMLECTGATLERHSVTHA